MTVRTTDLAISEVTKQAMLWRKENREHLAALLGLSLRSVARRIAGDISWEAHEIKVMSDHFGLPVDTFYDGPDALFGGAGPGVNPRYDDVNQAFTGVAA
jgi:hypothetical protein